MLLPPTSMRKMAHGNSPELCNRSWPEPQIMIFIFPRVTLSPLSSIASFQVKCHLTHSSSDSAMIRCSSTERSSKGTPEWNSSDKASSTMMKIIGLSTQPWWTPTFASYHCTHHQQGHGSGHLHTSPRPVVQSTPPHQVFSAPTRWPSKAPNQKPSLSLRKPCRVCCW